MIKRIGNDPFTNSLDIWIVYVLLEIFKKLLSNWHVHYFLFCPGGYIFFETSLLAAPVLRVDDITIREGQNAYIESPILGTTGAEGKCVGFR